MRDAQFTSNRGDPLARDDRLGDGKPLSNAAAPDAGRAATSSSRRWALRRG
jgi:hypothetical protein